jgi:pyocin large subunit-like protein
MRIAVVICWLLSWTAAFGLELAAPPTVELSSSNAVLHWRTDVASGTRAQIISGSAKISVPDKTPAATHTVVVSGLKPGVEYSVVVGSARVWLATNTFTAMGKLLEKTAIKRDPVPEQPTVAEKKTGAKTEALKAPPTRKIWANWPSLPDHFARHGADFHAKDADDYARMSWEFLQHAKADGLPAKVDEENVLRVFDLKSGTFASYNRDGTTKTFFKPGSRDYFERQPGKTINLKNWKEK